MMNRLRCIKQLALLVPFFFISFFHLNAQSCPDSTGNHWGMTLSNPAYWSDTVFINGFCDNELDVPTLAFSFFDGLMNTDYTFGPFSPILGIISPATYIFGYTIPPGEVINITYHLEAQHKTTLEFFRDTFCLELTYIDTIPPTFVGFIDESGNYTPLLPPQTHTPPVICPSDYPDTVFLVAEDCGVNIDTVLFTETPTPDPGMFCPGGGGMVMRTWSVMDGNGNMEEFTQFITILPDEDPPTLTNLPVSESVSCGMGDVDTWLNNQITTVTAPGNASDNCGIKDITYGIVSGDTTNIFCETIVLDFYIIDSCDDTTTVSVNYIITDDTAPTMMGLPAQDTILLSCGDMVPDPPVSVTAMDDCDTAMITVSYIVDTITTCDHSFKITRTWSAVDVCGNSNSFIQRIIMEDDEAPTFTVPSDVLFESILPLDPCYIDTDTSSTGNISGLLDNCSNVSDITLVMADSIVIESSCIKDTTIYRTWTATDVCGNKASKTQKISIRDKRAPDYLAPADITISCDASIDTSETGVPMPLANNCDLNPVFTFSDTRIPGGCEGEETIQRNWTITDACGFSVSNVQVITIVDTTAATFSVEAQDMSVLCDTDANLMIAFQAWLDAHGNAVASDNCAADSNLTWVAYNTGTTDLASLGSPSCPSPDSTFYRGAIVDFVVSDPCGNTRISTADFNIIDNIAPELSNLPTDQVNDTDLGICEATLTLPLPIVTDNCGNLSLSDMVTLGQQFTIPFGTDPLETPVDILVYDFSVPQPPFSAETDVSIIIDLVGVDAESPTEYFDIISEDGTVLGQTNLAADQCQNSQTIITLSATQYNQWAFDGTLTITLRPNIPTSLPGRFAINAICKDSAYVSLDYELVYPAGMHFEYEVNNGGRIDGGTGLGIIQPTETFGLGENEVIYYFTDCARNETSHTFKVTIEDNEAPTIDCPTPLSQVVGVDQGSCVAEMAIPLFTSVQDNCAVTMPFVQTQPTGVDQLMTFSFQPNLDDFLADDKEFVFSGVTDFVAPGFVSLAVEVLGDVDEQYEFFEIYDQNNNLLGTTEVGQFNVIAGDSCATPTMATFQIPSSTFNDWVANSDTIRFTARSFINIPVPPGGPDYGINPCDGSVVVADGQNDGVSSIWATLRYESIAPTLSGTGATDVTPIVLEPPLQAPIVTLDRGVTTFTYEVDDLEGNHGECQFSIEVIDNELPEALCKTSVFIEINPSGFAFDTIMPIEIDAGSFDNCGIASMEVSPNIIQCASASFFPVTLTVADSTGNVDVCQTFISVETEKPQPTILHECGNDSLFLFSNPPASPGGSNAFQYIWRDFNGVVIGVTENLVILDANEDNVGFYTVEIRGVTGCFSTGVVQITCDDLPLRRPVLTSSTISPCEQEDFTLSTDVVCGTSVIYKWYSGIAPNGTLLATTTDPQYIYDNNLDFNIYNFYVIVERNGCPSDPSVKLDIEVKEKPEAMPMVEFDADPPCEGGTIILTSPGVIGSTCAWTGPCGFSSTSCNPAPIVDITTCNGGNTPYTLVTTLNGCSSDPAPLFVNINARPEQPVITSNSSPANDPECVGGTITLQSTPISGAVSYRWEGPNGASITTADNILVLTDVNLGNQGSWTVTAVGNPCESEASLAAQVNVVLPPQAVSATATPNPICEGDELKLAAMTSSTDVSYMWTYPNGTQVAEQNPTVEDVQMPEDVGIYQVEVINQYGCRTIASLDVQILQNVEIAGVSAQVPNCVSGGVDIQMFAFPVTPANDGTYTWHWSGPDGFSYTSNDSLAVILDANSIDNSGQYAVFVTNGDGCVSDMETVDVNIPELIVTPIKPIANTPNPLCEGEIVILETSEYTQDVEYLWNTPLGIITTTSSTLEIDPLTVGNSGNYSVSVMLDGCMSNLSGFMTLDVNAVPVVNPISNSPVCEGDVLELSMNCNGDEYRWEGPGGFGISNLCTPVVAIADPGLHGGLYTASKKVDGCWSEEVSIFVEIKDKPESGTAIHFGPYCSDTEDVIVAISPATATANATYTWYEASTNTPLGSTDALSFIIPGADLYGNDCIQFYVVANVDGCDSESSNLIEVCLNTIPNNQANAGDDQQICEDETLTLAATPPTVGVGRWEQTDGPNVTTISNFDSPTTTVSDLQPGATYTFGWYLSNGACEDYSFDEVSIKVDIIEDAEAGVPIVACNKTSINLGATMPASGLGTWSQPAGQSALGIEIVDPENPTTAVTNLVLGNVYQFTWTIDGGCGTAEDVVNVTVVAEAAFAGEDFEDCGDGCTQLSANPTAVGGGVWTSSDPNVEIISPTSPTTMVCNMSQGSTTFTWTINEGACGDDSVDDVVVTYYFAPVAVDDQISIEFGGEGEINVAANDQIPGDYSIEILSGPSEGVYEFIPDGMISYEANINFIGEDVITYELCTVDCEDCSIANLTINIGADAQCVAPTLITPNGDGMNDSFIVPCLSDKAAVPTNTISIFNQWGDEVYHASPYNNDWEGTFDGEDLPAGTFFYILDLNNGQEPMTGFFVIQR
ncbi:MAG: gliding motility-associated C-terminal domain-containing protein [Saprospiraceae bacterium]|nr:gliding motility-associated C-terminal domain-containing protein [Saprospiraceae bacterium]